MNQFQVEAGDTREYPMGLTQTQDGFHISVACASKACTLLLYRLHAGQKLASKPQRIPFPEAGRIGNVWGMTLSGDEAEKYAYAFEADGRMFADPYGTSFLGWAQWGKIEQASTLPVAQVRREPFDWEGDLPLRLSYEMCIVYRAHVRGFTKHASSAVRDRGTFAGMIEKIPYLQELGITTLEILPAAEFAEVMVPVQAEGSPFGEQKPTGRLNYWGYTPALSCAPKSSYAGKGKDPVREFKEFVKALHRAGIELVMELFFDGQEAPAYVLDVVRSWVREYHLDGVHLTGFAPKELLARDPYLADTKLWANSWDGIRQPPDHSRHLAEYNEGFLEDMRRVLKGDEGQMNTLAMRCRRNPEEYGTVNFIAGTNGFTMMDMVSYERKHNEANGEDNRDGSDFNYSWNCGAEGPVRKKKIMELRQKQLRNAMLLVFLSQGTPLLLAGDEFGNSQNGNNNAYCQDNEISWLNWKQLQSNASLHAFACRAIAFRKDHPVFWMPKEPRLMDYRACGHPDVSYHGGKAWVAEYENFRRQLGIMYCGDYARRADGTADDYFYVAYNMHWEPFQFALPNLPEGLRWHLAFDTNDTAHNGFFADQEMPLLENQKRCLASPRTILVLCGKKGIGEDVKTLKKRTFQSGKNTEIA